MIKLEAEGLLNTRDLGGMKTEDGRVIKTGLLYRSGMLAPATGNDLKMLEDLHITAVIDLRSKEEIAFRPDPDLPGAERYYFPVDNEDEIGLRRDDEAEVRLMEILIDRAIRDPNFSVDYMRDMYSRLAKGATAGKYYREFTELVRKSEGALLWHCTVGKDRAGIAAAIIEKLLGVSDEDILEDYLLTNEYVASDTDGTVAMLKQKVGEYLPEKSIRELFAADERYIQAFYDGVAEVFGSWDGYFEKALGLDEEKRIELKGKYTEKS